MKEEKSDLETNLVCVICGDPWEPAFKNLCECGGFCSWGYEKGGVALSWGDPKNWDKNKKG